MNNATITEEEHARLEANRPSQSVYPIVCLPLPVLAGWLLNPQPQPRRCRLLMPGNVR